MIILVFEAGAFYNFSEKTYSKFAIFLIARRDRKANSIVKLIKRSLSIAFSIKNPKLIIKVEK